MSLQGQREARVVSPPQAEGFGSANGVHMIGVHDSGDPVDLGINIASAPAWFTFRSTVDTCIAFGGASVEVVTTDFLMLANREYRWLCNPATSRYFAAIKPNVEDPEGTLRYYCSQPSFPHQVAALAANAGADATLTYGTATPLDGSASGGVPPYTYAWSVLSQPEDGECVIADPAAADSDVTLGGPNGDTVLTLTVTDAALTVATDTVTLTLDATRDEILGALLLLRWDARDLADGAVSSWASTGSDTTALVQATGAKQPTRAATSFNAAHPGVTADGGDTLLATLAAPIAIGTRAYMFLAAQFNVVAASKALAQLTSNDDATAYLEVYINGSTLVTGYRDDDSGAGDTLVSGTPDTTPRIYEGGWTAAGAAAFVTDCAQRDSARTGTPDAAVNHCRLFAISGTPTQGSQSTVAEWIVCGGMPSEAQKAAVRALMRSDWAIAESLMSKTRMLRMSDVDPDIDGSTNFCEDAATDGTYVYFPPGSLSPAHKICRYDSRRPFLDVANAWAVKAIPGLAGITGGSGVCYDGARYLYLVTNETKLIRVDTQDFSADASYETFDLTGVTGIGTARGYCYPFYDGQRYVYLPHLDFTTNTGVHMVQFDTQAPFDEAASYTASPATTVFGTDCIGYQGGCVDPAGNVYFNGHGYKVGGVFVNHGHHLKYDPNLGAFDDPDAWSTFDSASLDADLIGMSSMFAGDGNYLYWTHGELDNGASDGHYIMRYNSALDFEDPDSWEFYDLSANVSAGIVGITKGFYDGRYVVMPNEHISFVALFDTQAAFDSAGSYQYLNRRFYGDGRVTSGHAGGCALNGAKYIAATFDPLGMKIA